MHPIPQRAQPQDPKQEALSSPTMNKTPRLPRLELLLAAFEPASKEKRTGADFALEQDRLKLQSRLELDMGIRSRRKGHKPTCTPQVEDSCCVSPVCTQQNPTLRKPGKP